MDSPADALVALSNTAAAIADSNTYPIEDDDRSSSLSELDDAPEPDNIDLDDDDDDDDLDNENDLENEGQAQDRTAIGGADDSEAETERLEESPDKQKRVFQTSPSKLAQSMTIENNRPEIEALTESEASSPMTPPEDSPLEDLSEVDDLEEPENPLNLLSQAATVTNKRKRLSDVMDLVDAERPRKRRTESVDGDGDEEKSDESEGESDLPDLPTREPTVEPEDVEAQAESENEKEEAHEPEQEHAELSDISKSKKPEQYTRSRSSRRGKDAADDAQDEDEDEAVEASDEEVDEGDDVDVVVKSEEEQARRLSAMESLMILERHFASLRDSLYDERISSLSQELSQLNEIDTTHPELLKQFDCINKYRNEKQEIEMDLLVFKVGALKRRSIAERAQINSSYFQTIRDIRERHMERMSEHFYQIQKERFKSTQITPTYTIPFPSKRVEQVIQQTAYNKEVSILSGVAKYIGFPAAPDLQAAQMSDLDGDLQKMGITYALTTAATTARTRASRHTPTANLNPTLSSSTALSSSAAANAAASEQQFLESTPWANPNHPVHRLGRQVVERSPVPNAFNNNSNSNASSNMTASDSLSTITPAHHQKHAGIDYTPQPHGSASTIPEHPSANPTPQTINMSDIQSSAIKHEPTTNGVVPSATAATTDGEGSAHPPSISVSVSPTETRRALNMMLQAGNFTSSHSAQHQNHHHHGQMSEGPNISVGVNSSPLQARASLLSSLNRTASRNENLGGHERTSNRSPFRQDLVASGSAGMRRFGFLQ